jgi:hypothetical protein
MIDSIVWSLTIGADLGFRPASLASENSFVEKRKGRLAVLRAEMPDLVKEFGL